VPKKILVVGELNADMIFSDMEVFPSLGQEIVAGSLHTVLGSSSAICAAGLARLGARVDFLGKVGVDYYGEFVTRELKDRGVGIQHIVHDQVVRTGLTLSLTYRRIVRWSLTSVALRSSASPISRWRCCGVRPRALGAYFLRAGCSRAW
jgi:bifunctional ADP-heptose synthase (sugar kinase/adenylyltransferase)